MTLQLIQSEFPYTMRKISFSFLSVYCLFRYFLSSYLVRELSKQLIQ
jgi:hypothetical protein